MCVVLIKGVWISSLVSYCSGSLRMLGSVRYGSDVLFGSVQFGYIFVWFECVASSCLGGERLGSF